MAVYDISDANPSAIHLTVPKSARLRRESPASVVVHHDDLSSEEINVIEGLPVTSIARMISDLLRSGGRLDLIRQAITDARREGYISAAETQRIRRAFKRHVDGLRAS
ncbi:MAG: hypothetical protein MUF01_13595 [Bryobacterales bacterium]|nr:hypothetical protein [Bryobacterales bacterium]